MGILSVLLWTPALGVLFLAFVSSADSKTIRWVANLFTVYAFGLSCWLAVIFNPNNLQLQFTEYVPLNPVLGSAYALGIDGLSMPMLVLATLLTCIALLASFSITSSIKGYYMRPLHGK